MQTLDAQCGKHANSRPADPQTVKAQTDKLYGTCPQTGKPQAHKLGSRKPTNTQTADAQTGKAHVRKL